MRRMDRYKDENIQTEKRSEKNKDLYQNTNKYTNITDVTNANVYEINNERRESATSRENYQKLKKYQNVEEVPKVKKDRVNVASRKRDTDNLICCLYNDISLCNIWFTLL